MDYNFAKTVNVAFDEEVQKVTDELKKEGFGILTLIDVKETFKNKLDVDFKKYKILGACNPPFAYRALKIEEQLGVFLPCNVVVSEVDSNNTKISFFNPAIMANYVDNPEIKIIAGEVKEKLIKVYNNL